MSLHRSLKTTATALNQHRSVLTRPERIMRLMEQDRFNVDDDSPLGLVKVINRDLGVKKKKAEKQEEKEQEAAEQPPADSTE